MRPGSEVRREAERMREMVAKHPNTTADAVAIVGLLQLVLEVLLDIRSQE